MEWAQAILRYDPQPEEIVTRELVPALTADFPTPAQRPLYSALDCEKFSETFGLRLPGWEETLRLAMQAGQAL
jgi:dTDP-4-dehydrorhamnose reductase